MANGWTPDLNMTPEEFWQRESRRRRTWLITAIALIVVVVVGLLELTPS